MLEEHPVKENASQQDNPDDSRPMDGHCVEIFVSLARTSHKLFGILLVCHSIFTTHIARMKSSKNHPRSCSSTWNPLPFQSHLCLPPHQDPFQQ